MTSCEPQRCSAYAEELRWRVVWQLEGLRCTQEQVARNLNIDQSTVSRIIQLFHTTGSVSKKIKSVDSAFRSLTSPAQFLILTLVIGFIFGKSRKNYSTLYCLKSTYQLSVDSCMVQVSHST
jgi:hypothetical protein